MNTIIKSIKIKLEALMWFYKKNHDFKLQWWPPESFMGPLAFDHFFSSQDAEEKIQQLKSNLDQDSLAVVDNIVSTYRCLEQLKIKRAFIEFERSPHEQEIELKTEELKKTSAFSEPHVSIFHHGLKNVPDSVRQYIAGKFFVDAGAYRGESVNVLKEYSPAHIYAFEISKKNIKKMKRALSSVSDLCTIVNNAVGQDCRTLHFEDTVSSSCTLLNQGKTQVDSVALDDFFKDRDTPVGFVKADIEGYAFEMIKGMTGLLQQDRPVLSIGIYHSPEEFFGIKPFVESLNLDYHFEIRSHSDHRLQEVDLIAYPEELK